MSLPEDIFWKLPKLMWLDLRNNMLESIPKSIAHHEHLENLLLTNNNLHELPNELGLVPRLKALQVSDNPLIYPPRKIIVEGTKAIKNYLKEQYEICNKSISNNDNTQDDDDLDLPGDERLLSVVETSSTEGLVNCQSDPTKSLSSKILSSKDSSGHKLRLSNTYTLPALNGKKLPSTTPPKKKQAETVKIVHRISRTNSRILLKSYFNKLGVRNSNNEKMVDKSLKEGWLNQLRILLMDQEKILQQERNLKALSEWRVKRRHESPKVFHSEPEPPYGTHPEFSKMPTREELASQLTAFFKEKGIVRAANDRSRSVDIEKLVSDLLEQLKEMESVYEVMGSPRSEMDRAGKQMRAVMDIQRKLHQVKMANDVSI
ncbi:hypothetical protein JTB14_002279 [Gonioctena quinquepunctata]|nr:hypothetical protein JTB14_002279 [Gonioctena quinquepunctata]